MKNYSILALCAICSLGAVDVSKTARQITAQTKVADLTVGELQELIQKEVKHQIKVVDPYVVIQGSKEWEDKQISMQKEAERQSKEIESIAMESERKKNELRNMATTAKKEVKEAKELEIYRLENDKQVRQQQAQRNLQEMYEGSQLALYKQIGDVAKEVAQAKGVQIVQAGGILYADPEIDISKEVLDRANQKYVAQKKEVQEKPITLARNDAKSDKK